MAKQITIQRTPKQLGKIDGIALLKYTAVHSLFAGKFKPKAEPWLHAAGSTFFNTPSIGNQFLLVYVWDTREVVGIIEYSTGKLTGFAESGKFKPAMIPTDNMQPLKLSDKLKNALQAEYGNKGLSDVEKQLQVVNGVFATELKRAK